MGTDSGGTDSGATDRGHGQRGQGQRGPWTAVAQTVGPRSAGQLDRTYHQPTVQQICLPFPSPAESNLGHGRKQQRATQEIVWDTSRIFLTSSLLRIMQGDVILIVLRTEKSRPSGILQKVQYKNIEPPGQKNKPLSCF